ncbi:uncharacterized protein LOC117649910 [Thrips palmi]|uniref:Uncharacterized protein LOC117649910 n=1 Tax=Thrips palmi TaxID=161013 RepID=A0A6P8ZUL3_THRPL|nr:uncharacterized protein LOC117649910 [Thrips palmi]
MSRSWNESVVNTVPVPEVRNAFASWSSRGGWRENALSMNIPRPCAALKTYFPGISKYVWNNLEGPGGHVSQIPVPPGSYSIRNLSMNLQDYRSTGLRSMFYGKWRMDSKVYDKDMCFMCVRVTAMVNPKAPSRARSGARRTSAPTRFPGLGRRIAKTKPIIKTHEHKQQSSKHLYERSK